MKKFIFSLVLGLILFASCGTHNSESKNEEENVSITYVSVNEKGLITRYEYETKIDSLIYKTAKVNHKNEPFTFYKLTYSPKLYEDYADEWSYLIKDIIEIPELAEVELAKYNLHITEISY